MPHKVRMFEFTVEGDSPFPVDMLRYDRCWPKSESRDSVTIGQSWDRHYSGPRKFKVTLVGIHTPTEGRWRSFSWTLLEFKEIKP